MQAKCMNSVPRPWWKEGDEVKNIVHCGWQGEVPKVEGFPCPRCSQVGVLSELVDVLTNTNP